MNEILKEPKPSDAAYLAAQNSHYDNNESLRSSLIAAYVIDVAPLIAEVERLTKERDEWQCWALRNDRELHAVSVAIGSVRFMDPPDGGDVSLAEQVSRQSTALASAERQNAALVKALRNIENHPEEYNSKRDVSFGVRWAFNNARAIARAALAQIDAPQQHASDCAVHNEPALPNGPCDCGAIDAPQLDTRDASAQRRVNVLRGALEVVRCQCSMLCAPDDPFNKGVLATIDAALSFPDAPRPDATSYTPIESFNELCAYLEAIGAQPDARDAALAEAGSVLDKIDPALGRSLPDRVSALVSDYLRRNSDAAERAGTIADAVEIMRVLLNDIELCGVCVSDKPRNTARVFVEKHDKGSAPQPAERPVTDEEVDDAINLYDPIVIDETQEVAMRAALEAFVKNRSRKR